MVGITPASGPANIVIRMQLAVLGLGFMGSVHARAIGPRLAAVYSSDPRKLTGDLYAVKGNLDGAGGTLDFTRVRPYNSIDALLADPAIDAVDLCLPTHLHEPVAIQALRAGKHVLVEKPLALDGASARRIIAEAETCRRTLMTAQVLRFFPEYVALRDALPELGPVRHATFHRRCAAPGWGGWLLDPARSGGGVFDLMIHDVDICLHLFGAPASLAATGHADAIHASLFYPDGQVAVVTGGWEPAPAYPFRMEYQVSGERGIVEYSSTGRPPTLYAGTERVLPLAATPGYEAEIDYFIACCESGRPPALCPPRESAQAVELMRLLIDARQCNGEKIPCNL
jgi:predicted dehydrogenase